MTVVSFFALCAAMLLLAASPGPGVFATVSRALATGFRSALSVIMGIVIGDIIFLMLAIFGLSAVAHLLGDLFTLVRIIGGLYLVWLGIRIWTSRTPENDGTPPGLNDSASGGVLSGLLITLSNPKVILFYCGFLPTVLNLSTLDAVDILCVVLTISTILAVVLATYAYAAGWTRQAVCSRKAMRRLNRLAGGMMVAAGVAVAAKSGQ